MKKGIIIGASTLVVAIVMFFWHKFIVKKSAPWKQDHPDYETKTT